MEILKELEDTENQTIPVIINNETGSNAVVNISSTITNNVYQYPDWLNEDAVARIIDRIKG